MNYVKIKRYGKISFFSYHDFLSGLFTTRDNMDRVHYMATLRLSEVPPGKWRVDHVDTKPDNIPYFSVGQIVTEIEAERAFEWYGVSKWEEE